MSDQPAVDLSALVITDTPEVVGPALSRFRRRIARAVLLGLLVPVIWVLIPLGVILWQKHVKADFEAIRPYAGSTAPKERGDMVLFAEDKLPLGRDWRAYAWKSPTKGAVSQDLDACWAVFLSTAERNPSVDCADRSRFASGASVQHFLTAPDGGSPGFTSITGATLPKVRRLRISSEGLAEGRSVQTFGVKGARLRIFALVVPTAKEKLSKLEIEAYDSAGRLIPAPPKFDARSDLELSPQAKKAAEAAVAAAGDSQARVLRVEGPRLYRIVSQSSDVSDLTVDPNLPVYSVSLEGRFKRYNIYGQDMEPREAAEVIVAAPDSRVLYITFASST